MLDVQVLFIMLCFYQAVFYYSQRSLVMEMTWAVRLHVIFLPLSWDRYLSGIFMGKLCMLYTTFWSFLQSLLMEEYKLRPIAMKCKRGD